MKRKLNEITADISSQQWNLQFIASEDKETALKKLEELYTELAQKEDGIFWFFKRNEHEIAITEEYAKKIQARIKNMKYLQERLKFMILEAYEETQQLPKYSVFNPISIRKSGGAVDIIDDTKIPEEYYTEEIVVKLNKKKLLENLRNGVKIPGVRLKQNNYVGGLKKDYIPKEEVKDEQGNPKSL